MIPRLLEAQHRGGTRVWLRFKDGVEGEIDLGAELWGDVFEPLKDVAEFAKLRADPELHTLFWPNGADFSPEWLHEQVTVLRSGSDAAE